MSSFPTRQGAYPGSFNPPTIAHLAIAAAAREQRRLDRVDLVVSLSALDKEQVSVPPFEDRLAVLRSSVADIPWLNVVCTSAQLLVEIAQGYDVLIMGADKWFQIQELRFYPSAAERDAAMARLPELAIAPRASITPPPPSAELPPDALIDVSVEMTDVSSTKARAGRPDWMTEAARQWAESNNGWGSV